MKLIDDLKDSNLSVQDIKELLMKNRQQKITAGPSVRKLNFKNRLKNQINLSIEKEKGKTRNNDGKTSFIKSRSNNLTQLSTVTKHKRQESKDKLGKFVTELNS